MQALVVVAVGEGKVRVNQIVCNPLREYLPKYFKLFHVMPIINYF